MPNPEFKQDLTADEAVDVLADRSHMHPDVRKYFGETLVNELLDILEDNEIFELDAMLLQGDLTIQEMEEYLMLLPTYHQLQRNLNDWGDKLIKHVTRRLEGTLRESVDKHGRLKNTHGLARMQKSIFDMIESFDNVGFATKRNALLFHLKNHLAQALLMDIWYKVVSEPRLKKYKPVSFNSSSDSGFSRSRSLSASSRKRSNVCWCVA